MRGMRVPPPFYTQHDEHHIVTAPMRFHPYKPVRIVHTTNGAIARRGPLDDAHGQVDVRVHHLRQHEGSVRPQSPHEGSGQADDVGHRLRGDEAPDA